jgi:uncharacterized membrane protein YgcG
LVISGGAAAPIFATWAVISLFKARATIGEIPKVLENLNKKDISFEEKLRQNQTLFTLLGTAATTLIAALLFIAAYEDDKMYVAKDGTDKARRVPGLKIPGTDIELSFGEFLSTKPGSMYGLYEMTIGKRKIPEKRDISKEEQVVGSLRQAIPKFVNEMFALVSGLLNDGIQYTQNPNSGGFGKISPEILSTVQALTGQKFPDLIQEKQKVVNVENGKGGYKLEKSTLKYTIPELIAATLFKAQIFNQEEFNANIAATGDYLDKRKEKMEKYLATGMKGKEQYTEQDFAKDKATYNRIARGIGRSYDTPPNQDTNAGGGNSSGGGGGGGATRSFSGGGGSSGGRARVSGGGRKVRASKIKSGIGKIKAPRTRKIKSGIGKIKAPKIASIRLKSKGSKIPKIKGLKKI